MTQRHTAQAIGTRSLVWLLVLAVLLLGLSVTRQQALGALHWHADAQARKASAVPSSSTSVFTSSPTSKLSALASGLAQDWLSRRQQQQVFGHGQVRVGLTAAPTLWATSAQPDGGRYRDVGHSNDHHGSSHDHDHAALERHHHALGDDSVIALDGAAEAADLGSVGAALLLPFTNPSLGLAWASTAARNGPWPVLGAVRFASRKVVPLLRPPAFSHTSRAA